MSIEKLTDPSATPEIPDREPTMKDRYSIRHNYQADMEPSDSWIVYDREEQRTLAVCDSELNAQRKAAYFRSRTSERVPREELPK